MTFDQFRQKLGKRLYDMRRAAGMTQQELATKAKVTRQHIQRIERGETNPTLATLYALGKTFKLSVTQLTAL